MDNLNDVTNRAMPIGMVNTVRMVEPIKTVEPSEIVNADGKTLDIVNPTINNVKQSSENGDTNFISTLKDEVNNMADVTTTPVIPTGDMLGGGTFGGFLLGALLAGRGGLLGNGGAVAGEIAANNDVLHTLNMQSLYDMGNSLSAGQAATNQNITNTAAGLANAIAGSTLNLATSNLQGFNATQNMIAGNAADINGSINNATQVTTSAVREVGNTLDMDIHSMESNISRSIESVRNDVARSNDLILASAHSAEINALKGQAAIMTEIANQGSMTRDLINANQISDLERQLSDHRHRASTDAIIINNNNNATAVSTAISQQQQQAQLTNLAATVGALLSQVNTQSTIIAGNRGTTTTTPTAVNA